MRFPARLGALALGLMMLAPASAAVPTATKPVAPAGFPPIENPCDYDDGTGVCTGEGPTAPLHVTAPRVTATSYSTTVATANSAVTLIPASTTRNGTRIQNQSAGRCWISGTATATEDQNSLRLEPGDIEETSSHVSTGAVSIICNTANAAIYARAW